MKIEQLVKMANDIADYFNAEPDREVAVEGARNHLRRFWDPRMRQQIIAHLQSGGDGLSGLASEAVKRLETEDAQKQAS